MPCSVMYVFSMARKKISTTIYITEEQNAKLKQLNEKTKVPVAEYIRQGIDMILKLHRDHLPGQMTFEDSPPDTPRPESTL